jgi:hypothetical protein
MRAVGLSGVRVRVITSWSRWRRQAQSRETSNHRVPIPARPVTFRICVISPGTGASSSALVGQVNVPAPQPAWRLEGDDELASLHAAERTDQPAARPSAAPSSSASQTANFTMDGTCGPASTGPVRGYSGAQMSPKAQVRCPHISADSSPC